LPDFLKVAVVLKLKSSWLKGFRKPLLLSKKSYLTATSDLMNIFQKTVGNSLIKPFLWQVRAFKNSMS
jgi:hypothetical protein